MTFIQATILGIVQGLAEFLPISSSGHLAILQNIFGVEESDIMLFTILLHLGSLTAVFVVYWKDIWALILELIATIKDICTGKGLMLEGNLLRKFGCMIIVSCIPTAIIGLLFEDVFENMYSSLYWIASGLIITGILLFIADRQEGTRGIEKMNFRNAFFVGIIQGIALWPGISRSGSTLFGSLVCRLEKELAVKFVFIISIPAILGSAILEIPDAVRQGIDTANLFPVIWGMLMSFVFGYLAIRLMIKLVTNNKLRYFSYYVWTAAIAIILYSIF